ncbi:hypothetical protein IFM89_008210, partial [Coptis chinensis]
LSPENFLRLTSIHCSLGGVGALLQCICISVHTWTVDTLSLWLSLAPVVIENSGVASLTELSFNWLGFSNAMISNISFTYRSTHSKKAIVILPYDFYCFMFSIT